MSLLLAYACERMQQVGQPILMLLSVASSFSLYGHVYKCAYVYVCEIMCPYLRVSASRDKQKFDCITDYTDVVVTLCVFGIVYMCVGVQLI